jgi:hypothetical protein
VVAAVVEFESIRHESSAWSVPHWNAADFKVNETMKSKINHAAENEGRGGKAQSQRYESDRTCWNLPHLHELVIFNSFCSPDLGKMQVTTDLNLPVVAQWVCSTDSIEQLYSRRIILCHRILPKICHACVSPKLEPNFPHVPHMAP